MTVSQVGKHHLAKTKSFTSRMTPWAMAIFSVPPTRSRWLFSQTHPPTVVWTQRFTPTRCKALQCVLYQFIPWPEKSSIQHCGVFSEQFMQGSVLPLVACIAYLIFAICSEWFFKFFYIFFLQKFCSWILSFLQKMFVHNLFPQKLLTNISFGRVSPFFPPATMSPTFPPLSNNSPFCLPLMATLFAFSDFPHPLFLEQDRLNWATMLVRIKDIGSRPILIVIS